MQYQTPSIHKILEQSGSRDELRSLVYDKGIQMVVEAESQGRSARVLFKGRYQNTDLHRSCLGTVAAIDSEATMIRYLSYMPPAQSDLDIKRRRGGRMMTPKEYDMVRNFQQFDIRELADGTMVTLYYYGKKWQIATHNGYSVGGYSWFGTITYDAMLGEVEKMYPDFSLDKLNKDHSYVLIVHHPSFHPHGRQRFTDERCRAWYIMSTDIASVNKGSTLAAATITDEDIGLPHQQRYSAPSISSLVETCVNAHDYYLKTGQPFYGVLVVLSKAPREVMIVRSSLYHYIQDIFYNQPAIDKVVRETGMDRQKYIILRKYLQYTMEATQESKNCEYDNFNKFLGTFTNLKDIIISFDKRSTWLIKKADPSSNLTPKGEQPKRLKSTARIVRKLYEHHCGPMEPLPEGDPAPPPRFTLEDYIMRPDLAQTLYKYMCL